MTWYVELKMDLKTYEKHSEKLVLIYFLLFLFTLGR